MAKNDEREYMESLKAVLPFIGLVVGYVILITWILPKLGVQT
jgi:hypothetical protein